MTREATDPKAAADALRAGDRRALARAITLAESRNPTHRLQAEALLAEVLPDTGDALRLGLTGVPGVGKSTFIEALGLRLLAAGKTVAVLAVDPSSQVSGGSILGDKTRMERLAADPRAFIRPTPTSGSLGGVARRTRDALLLCEAAGFDVVLVETVGVGQSEVAVSEMVDMFLLLLLPGSGDELQGLKKGIVEIADAVIINKADGDLLPVAQQVAADYRAALRLLRAPQADWRPPVLLASALTDSGIAEVWETVEAFQAAMTGCGAWQAKRARQAKQALWRDLRESLLEAFDRDSRLAQEAQRLEQAVEAGNLLPALAARQLLEAFQKAPD